MIRPALAANPLSAGRELITQLWHHAEISASRSTMYRTKETVVAEMFSEDPWTVRLLTSFVKEFQRLNLGTEIECYKTGNYEGPLW